MRFGTYLRKSGLRKRHYLATLTIIYLVTFIFIVAARGEEKQVYIKDDPNIIPFPNYYITEDVTMTATEHLFYKVLTDIRDELRPPKKAVKEMEKSSEKDNSDEPTVYWVTDNK